MPDASKPFKWGALADTDMAGMTLSMFPIEDTSTGLTTLDKLVEIEIKGLTWDDYSSFTAPGAASAPTTLETALSATFLAGGLLASATVAASLF